MAHWSVTFAYFWKPKFWLFSRFLITVGRTYETQAASAEIQQDTRAHRAREKGKQSAHSPTFSAQFSTASCLVVFTCVSLYVHATVLFIIVRTTVLRSSTVIQTHGL